MLTPLPPYDFQIAADDRFDGDLILDIETWSQSNQNNNEHASKTAETKTTLTGTSVVTIVSTDNLGFPAPILI